MRGRTSAIETGSDTAVNGEPEMGVSVEEEPILYAGNIVGRPVSCVEKRAGIVHCHEVWVSPAKGRT